MNLTTFFGQEFRIAYDSAHSGSADDPSLQIIPCSNGHIYFHGGDKLAFASTGRGSIARRVADLPGATVEQEGDDGLNITFPLELFEQVAQIVEPHRR